MLNHKAVDTINVKTDHSEEGCAGLVGDGLRQQGLASARGAVQDHLDTALKKQFAIVFQEESSSHPLGRLDPHLLVVLGVGEGQLHRFLDLLQINGNKSSLSKYINSSQVEDST